MKFRFNAFTAAQCEHIRNSIYTGISIAVDITAIGCNFRRPFRAATIRYDHFNSHRGFFFVFAKTSANYVVCIRAGELKVGRANTYEARRLFGFSSNLQAVSWRSFYKLDEQ